MTAGGVYLGGGGSARDEERIWRLAFAGSPRTLYWPFALPDGPLLRGATDWLTGSLDELGLTAQVETWNALAGHQPTELDGFDLLFVGGGNTFALLRHLQDHRFVEPVQRFVESGGSYCGGSAGAVLATASIVIAELGDAPADPQPSSLHALALVPAAAGHLLPHYTPGQAERARGWAAAHDAVVLGIPEACGLAKAGPGEPFVVAGPAPVTRIEPTGGLRVLEPGAEVPGTA